MHLSTNGVQEKYIRDFDISLRGQRQKFGGYTVLAQARECENIRRDIRE